MDLPLNETGRAQARLAGVRLARLGATALYSSDLLRAYETAQIIGQGLGLQVMQKPGLREINFGVWQGLSSPQIRERDPEVYAARRAESRTMWPAQGLRHGGSFMTVPCGRSLRFWLRQRRSVSLWWHTVASARWRGYARSGSTARGNALLNPTIAGFIRLPCRGKAGARWL